MDPEARRKGKLKKKTGNKIECKREEEPLTARLNHNIRRHKVTHGVFCRSHPVKGTFFTRNARGAKWRKR